MGNDTINRAYAQVPREIPNPVQPLERARSPLRRFLVHVDVMAWLAGGGLALFLAWPKG